MSTLYSKAGTLALLATACFVTAARADWGTYQGGPAHTGYVATTVNPAQMWPLWHTPVTSIAITGLAVGDGTVVATNAAWFNGVGSVHALDATTGNPLWSKAFTNNNATVSPPAYANGVVYVQNDGHSAGTGNYLNAFDAQTGAEVFRAPYEAQWETYLNPTPYDGAVYVGGGYYGGMYSFDGSTGAQRWFGNVPQYDGWTPAVDGRYAYAYTGSGSTSPISGVFTVLDLATGATAARVSDPVYDWRGYTMNSAVVLGSDHDAFTVNGGRLVRWDTTLDATHTPHIAWSITGSFGPQPSLAGSRLYVSSGGQVQVLDEETGATLWTWAPASGAVSQLPLIVTDNVLFAQSGSAVYAVDLRSHTTIWSYPVTGTMAVSDDRLYVGAANGSVYAFAIPEPGSAGLVMVASAAALLSRRRRAAGM